MTSTTRSRHPVAVTGTTVPRGGDTSNGADAAAGPPADAGQRPPGRMQGTGLAVPGAASQVRPNATRNRHAISSTVSTPATLRERSGGNTPLTAIASLSAAEAGGAGTVRGNAALGRAWQTLRAISGAPDSVGWLQQRMGSLRSQALDRQPLDDQGKPAVVRLPLGGGASRSPVTDFWAQPSVVGAVSLGTHHGEVTAELDRIARTHGAHVGLGLSFALLAAASAPDAHQGGATIDLGVLQAFRGHDPIPRMMAADASGDATAALALSVMHKLARSNQFPALARAMAPGLQQHEFAPLQRWLSSASRADSDGPDSLAGRVHAAAGRQLAGDAAAPDRRAVVDAFLWDNGFHAEGPGTPLAAARQHFANAVAALAHEPGTGGLLSAAHAFGLSGADRALLVDEAARLTALRDSPELDRLVERVRHRLEAELQASLDEPSHPQSPNRPERALARLLALEDWSPERKGTLNLQEMISGRRHARGDEAVQLRVEQASHRLGLDGDVEAGRPAPPVEERARRLAHVHGELSLQRLGVEELVRWADELNVDRNEADKRWADDASALIHGHTRKPGERTTAAVGEMLGEFLEQVQFGNHARLSHVSGAALTARGAGFNATAFEEGNRLATWGPQAMGLAVGPTVNFSHERATEQVLRVGAATHGVEILMGRQHEASDGEGLGLGVAYPNDRSLIVRGAVGIDSLYRAQRRTDLEGLMLRLDRQVVEDRMDDAGQQVFRQNDDAVRSTAAELARTIAQHAPAATDDAARAALLDDLIVRFGDRGLSMTLLSSASRTRRSELGVGVGVSAAAGPPAAGVRVGGSVGVGAQYAPSTELSQRDTTGRLRITMERSGWYARARLSGGVSANAYVGAVGVPPVPIARGSQVRDEVGGAVRVRIPRRDGNIVPEKTFSDTDTASPAMMRQIVEAKRQAWVDLFAFPHRADADQGRAKGEQALEDFFRTIEHVRAGNHRYYARERLHPEVAQRLDELTSLASLAPASLAATRDEIAHQQRSLLVDDRSWVPASLIAYERHAVEQGLAGGVGVQGRHTMASEGEREFVFHTPGWAALRERERTELRSPASLEAMDRRARTDPGTEQRRAAGEPRDTFGSERLQI